MRTVDEKLNSLNAQSVWYFAKQDTNFDNAFKAVQIFDQIPDREQTNIEDYYSTNADRFNYHSNHRALSVAQMFGLLTKQNPGERGSRYNLEQPTPVFRVLNQYAVGSSEYNAIKTEQLLKIRMSAITDSRSLAGRYKINPILFAFEVFWKLHLSGIDSISLPQFYTYIMTCESHDEIDEAVELLRQNPRPSQFVETYMANSRVVNIIQNNFNLLTFANGTVSVTPAFEPYFSNFFNGPYKPIVKMLNMVVDNMDLYIKVLTNYIGIGLDFVNVPQISISTPHTPIQNQLEITTEMKNYIDALKTKPFLLLAGISGTGKSQIVKELAYMTCPADNGLQADKNTPGNYCLIEVKPNWHDSTELLGYYSNLTQKYYITPFLHFVYKATLNPTVPFFVCLDEMNLAPVEQYFAEYLSVLETRAVQDGKIVSAELLSKKIFEGCEMKPDYTDSEKEVLAYLKENGLRLPENLFVVGTVNMDDTTHQFSRKVIDRAFTIEMNGDELSEMFNEDNEKTLEYAATPLSLDALKPKYVRAADALKDEKIAPYKNDITTSVPATLGAINNILKNTPFRVSYRVQNELVLYLSTLILNSGDNVDITKLIDEATLVILLEKILPRVQGDEKLLNTESGNVFKRLKELITKDRAEEAKGALYTEICAKLDEMDTRLTNTYFANFF